MVEQCLQGTVYSAVANAVTDLDTLCRKLVNGYCAVVFAGCPTAVVFEARTGEKRGPQPPQVENTVKGPKDAFTETGRTNTSLVRRHLRTPDLRIWETTVGRRTLTNVSVVWIKGITDVHLVERMKQRLQEILCGVWRDTYKVCCRGFQDLRHHCRHGRGNGPHQIFQSFSPALF